MIKNIKNFLKYQSLGNDFILFDFYNKNNIDYKKIKKNFIIKICNRNFGIGADGVLVLKKNRSLNLPEVLIFNSDGSAGETCLNGLRCVADYLFTHYDFLKKFSIKMGERVYLCQMTETSVNQQIQTKICFNQINYLGLENINIKNKIVISGYRVNLGNPHLVVISKNKTQAHTWFKKYSSFITSQYKVNTHFIYKKNNNYFFLLTYERGVGITLACSSGAVAAIYTLYQQKKIILNQKIILKMLGGELLCWIEKNNNNNKNIIIQAAAQRLFSGYLE